MFFFQLDLHWDSPKLPWGIQQTCEPFVLKTIIIIPLKRIFVLWHSLIRSLYFIQVHIFIPLIITFRLILALFTQFTVHQFFSYVYYYTNLGVVVVNSSNSNIPDALWEITLAWAWVRLAEVTVKWSKSIWGGVLKGRLTAADFAKAFKLYQTLF